MKKLLLLFFLVFSFSIVKAANFNDIQIAYGYDRGTDSGIWSGYSSTLSHNFGTTDPTIGYINTLNTQLFLNDNFQNGSYYSITYNWTNEYTGYSNSFTFYDALQEMGYFNLRCSTSTTAAFLDAESCFSSFNFRFERTSNNSVRGVVSFVPIINFRRILLNVTREGSPNGSQLVSNSFVLSNFTYSVSSGGTAEIIDNASQNTQDIIDNQNENTADIIQNINDNFNGCFNYDNTYSFERNPYYNNFGSLTSSGNIIPGNGFRYTYYLIVSKDKTYFIHRTNNNLAQYYCLYDTNKSLISCSSMGSNLSTNFVPSQDGFVRITYSISGSDTLQFTGQYCTSKFYELNEDVLSSAGTISNSIQQQIDSQKVCNSIQIDKSSIVLHNSYMNLSGVVNSSSIGNGITDYISIDQNSLITVTKTTSDRYTGMCFYNSNKSLLSCIDESTLTLNQNLTIPQYASYVRFTINENTESNYFDRPNFVVSRCIDGNQAINDSITDSSIDSNTGTGFFDNFTSEDFGLSQIITIPLTTIQSLTSKTCIPLQIPIPFTNSNVTLPCMTEVYEARLPSIYNLWKIVSFGIIAYLISIDIFHIVKGFKDPESDKVEVLDL